MFVLVGFTFFAAALFVPQQEVYLIERFGKFKKIVSAGLNFRVPFIDFVKGKLDLRLQQLDLQVETKTLDNVFVRLALSIQYKVTGGKEYDAFYSLDDVKEQISSYVFNTVRSTVPGMKLDGVFENKDAVADAVVAQLKSHMDQFGYTIVSTLITAIRPSDEVVNAMNKINATLRLKEAAQNEAEAEKIKSVKAAEAEAESKKLQGEGIANQRKAIIGGFKESVEDFTKATGTKPDEVMVLVLMTQYFDTLREMAEKGKTNSIFLPSSPQGVGQIMNEIRTSILSAGYVNKSE